MSAKPSSSLLPGLSRAIVPVLIVLLVASSFLIGVLWTKVSYLEKGGVSGVASGGSGSFGGGGKGGSGTVGGAAQGQQASPLSIDSLKIYAKELGLNEKNFASCLDDGKKKALVDSDVAQGSKNGVSGTPAIFLNGHLISGALPYDVFSKLIDFELSGGDWKNPDSATGELIDRYQVGKDVVAVDVGGAPKKGGSNAKITLVEFSDFECPFCGRFFSQAFGEIDKNYIQTGKVQFVYKHFPLTSIHTNAQKAAEASVCAAEQGKFWEYHDRIFQAMNSKS